MKKVGKTEILLIIFTLYAIISLISSYQPGKNITYNFLTFSKNMGLLLPPVFVLIGLFEVWIKKETIEKHLGEKSGIKSYMYMILLSSTMIGGLVVALPIAISLLKKGAKPSVIYTFISSSAVCRIPMTFFEATFLGIKFTAIRLLVSLPLIIAASMFMGRFCKIQGEQI